MVTDHYTAVDPTLRFSVENCHYQYAGRAARQLDGCYQTYRFFRLLTMRTA
jgi:hypothetical protein